MEMKKYLVTYCESYSDSYEVKADSREEAEEIVKDDIFAGRRNAPENCYDSSCEAELMEE